MNEFPEILYHFSNPMNRDSILRHGLLRSNSRAMENAIFFTDTVNPTEIGNSDVWAVNVKGLNLESDWTTEPFDKETWYVCFEKDVEPNRIKLIKQGVLKSAYKMNYRRKIGAIQDLSKSIVYTAIVLSKEDKLVLFDAFPPQHKLIQDGHVTLEFRPGKFPDNLGKPSTFTVYGYANDDNADAVSVKLNGVDSKNEIPHITLSVKEGVKPVYSNELLSKGYEACEPFTLTGTIAAFISGQGYMTKLPEPEIPAEPPRLEQPIQEIKKAPEI